ncbi:5-hydroxytryptamine receptor 1A-like [Copidosoma floridanum]|uniref:5-hydroxytryptamine receptor 1A-like n=1 Tax=Copidosoma floridanum TaxID=29053 RepID=UPI0006C9436C|nr:5-hydroxytryptamine receptor 1A-like [Copidosoma floridanum]
MIYSFIEHHFYWMVVYIVLLLIIILGNVMTILAIKLSRKLISVTSNRLILSLAVSDLLVAPGITYDVILFINKDLDSKILCLLKFFFLCFACTASFYNITAIAVDRYVSIKYPFGYPKYMTKRITFFIITINWSAALLVSTVPLYWNTFKPGCSCTFTTSIPKYYVEGVLIPNFLIVWLSILILHGIIWREARAYTRRSKARSREIGLSSNASYSKSNQAVLTILGCFSLCWLPYIAVMLLQVLRYEPSLIVYFLVDWLAMCNCGINPFLYAWKNLTFRKAYSHLLRCKALDPGDHNAGLDNHAVKQKETAKSTIERKHDELQKTVVK